MRNDRFFRNSAHRGWLNAVHPDDRPLVHNCWSEALRRGAGASEFRILRPDGDVAWVATRVTGLKNREGEYIGGIGTVVDITQRKRIEAASQRVHDEALAASRAKDDFLAMLSHELRTPLNPVLLLAGDAARNRDLPPGARADFDAIRKNIETEARLIDDLLDITRITHGKLVLEKQPLQANDLLLRAVAMVQSEADHKKIKLRLALGAQRQNILGDSVRLQQAFWNILKNAIKFTPEGGAVVVGSANAGAEWKLTIADTGIGIDAIDLNRIFEPFSQGSQSSRGGLGLGLAISKKLVEMHNGSIRATSEGDRRGAEFFISLPLQVASTSAAHHRPENDATMDLPSDSRQLARRSRILLVEDHEPTRAALTRLLLRRRLEVTGAASVAEARSVLNTSEQGFDLLISDIGLPDGSGYDLMNEVREEHGVEGIALTGYGMEEDVQRSYAAGFITHLTKPVKIESLDQALASALHRR